MKSEYLPINTKVKVLFSTISNEASSSAETNVSTLENLPRNILLEKDNVSSLFPGIVSTDCKLRGDSVSLSSLLYSRKRLEANQNHILSVNRV